MPILNNQSVLEWDNAGGRRECGMGMPGLREGCRAGRERLFCGFFGNLLSLDKAGAWLECVSLNPTPAPAVKQNFWCNTPQKLGCALEMSLLSPQPGNYPPSSARIVYFTLNFQFVFCTQFP